MRILVIHNYYRTGAPSGEDAVFQNECELLRAHGNEVITYTRSNDEIDATTFGKMVRTGWATGWSKKSYRELTTLIRQHKPDIAHFHNTFQVITPSGYAACRDQGIPVIQTLHNFRLICPGALLQRDGHPCEDCVGTNLIPALRHRCYRGSLAATGSLVGMLVRNRLSGNYNKVDRYIALTHFAADRLIAGQLPEHAIRVKPNFLPDPPGIGKGGGDYAVYVGRLSAEKGLHTLLKAWQELRHIPLKVAGAGDLLEELQHYATTNNLPIEFLGYTPREEVLKLVADARYLVIPSEWYEGFPMVVLEAYAMGTPVIASRIGSLQEIVKDGITGMTFTPGDAADLAAKIRSLHDDHERLQQFRTHARREFETAFTADQNYDLLMDIYEDALTDNAQQR